MKELLARVVYWLVGYVMWSVIGHDRIVYTEDDGDIWEAHWWIFHEEGSTQHDSITRTVGCVSVWWWADEIRMTKWLGHRLHFAYRHSFRSGHGVVTFIRMYGVAYRLGL